MEKDLVKVADIEKFSIVDWPTKIAAVIFLQGCPWRCPFCYNQSLQDINGEGNATWNNVLNLLEHRKGMLDGVVFSGGEPLVHSNLAVAMKTIKDMGFDIGLHTGGYNPTALEKVLPYISWVGFDIKSPFEGDRYKQATGGIADVEKVKQSLGLLLKSNIHFECRTTCDPRILDVDDIYKIADTLNELGVKEYYIQKYRPIESDKTTTDADCEKFFTPQVEAYLKNKFETYGLRK